MQKNRSAGVSSAYNLPTLFQFVSGVLPLVSHHAIEDVKATVYVFHNTKTKKGETGDAGLVCWHDRNMVYCLLNDSNNFQFDKCSWRGNGGTIKIPRPLSIANYNKYMGDVDLADMRRLHCNPTIMGQNWWWLKLFFYLLDVGTSNALVLYNESLKIRSQTGLYSPMNIVDFKLQLIEGLVGRTLMIFSTNRK